MIMKKIKAGIIGGAGYTGGEMIRLLINHPWASIAFVYSTSNAGNKVSKVHADLNGDTDLVFTDVLSNDIDVLFLCVGHGDAAKFLAANKIDAAIKIIDLSQDFRLQPNAVNEQREFVYGLPELNKEAISTAKNIANPGCFATAIQLGLLPLAKAGILGDVYTTGITGSTGAGQGLSPTSHFSWRANNIQAYKTLQHQHLHEVHQSLQQLQGNDGMYVNFVPWRGDFTRGIYVSSIIDCALPLEEVTAMYTAYYSGHPFTHVSETMIDLKQVVNTNKCLLYVEKQGTKVVVHSAIDNLLKGACGQAVQNMNILFQLDETAGLRLKSTGF
jgi:N-acetyl-gamma-glutamyl-phosphate reductase